MNDDYFCCAPYMHMHTCGADCSESMLCIVQSCTDVKLCRLSMLCTGQSCTDVKFKGSEGMFVLKLFQPTLNGRRPEMHHHQAIPPGCVTLHM